ncbi:RNA polymerase II-associated protein [Crucibulum laeve]|uniref:RNA polymerase II-associated protein n=1 Tax=Crucibulum laeve TaxID=68775 RepID=A0A5C3MFD7_9AGAR|nr:RNA polymerase II-associated protein [Crucibulum laeve]
MSFKKSAKLDLLVRVRYSNPLPAPPCPPKLLDIPTNPLRYARPEFLNAIAEDALLPMIVDAECGMPLDLGKWESLWEEGADDSSLNPDPSNLPKLDPKDAFLLADPVVSVGGFTHGQAGPSNGPAPAPHVLWLRRTEYISSRDEKRGAISEPKHVIQEIDVSRNAQLRDIETSFKACNDDFDVSTIRHPNKPNVTAVESFPVLPDSEIWANQYDLFRFSERPGERALDVEDPRLDCAILRPMKTEHDSFLAYYLTQDDESAEKFKEQRFALQPYEVSEDQEETIFHFVRDYETVKVEQEVPNEFLLVLNDGESQDLDDVLGDKPAREKGAYYKNIERKMLLKKKRANAYEQYDDKWEIIRVKHAPMSKEEEEEREEALAEVADPEFLTTIRDADADGEIEVDEMGRDIDVAS